MTVYIYGTIGRTLFGDGITEDDVREALADEHGDEVVVAINSHGGDPFIAQAIGNLLRRHDAKVVVEVDGLAASAATIVMMAGDEVRMPKSALMMIHNAWTVEMGDHHELRKTADDMEKITESMITQYQTRFNGDEDELRQMLDDETWLSALDSQAFGFADVILDDENEDDVAAKVAAQFDLRRKIASNDDKITDFNHVPSKVVAMVTRGAKLAAVQSMAAASLQRGADKMEPENETSGATSAPQEEERAVGTEPAVAARDSGPAEDGLVDADEIRAQERTRCARIRQAGRMASIPQEQIDQIIDKGLPVGDSLDLVIEAKASAQRKTECQPIRSTNREAIYGGETETQKLAKAVKSSIKGRLRVEDRDAKNEFNGFTLMELSREWLRRTGNYSPGMAKSEICAAIFAGASGNIGRHTRTDFPEILKDVAHNEMSTRFQEVSTTYPMWTRSGQLSDFRTHHRTRVTQFQRFKKVVPEKGKFERATFGDKREEIFLTTYGLEFAITRQAIIDDKVGAFTEIPGLIGDSAARSIQFLVSALLVENTQTMVSTDNVLFHNDHGNLIDEALSDDGLTVAEQKFLDQRDEEGEGSLLIAPEFLLVGSDLKRKAWGLTQSPTMDGQANPAEPNPWNQLQLIVDPNLNYSGIGGVDGHWYLGGPQNRSAIEVAGLDGPPMPRIIQTGQGSAHGVEFEGFYDVGVRAVEHKSILKSTGG